MNFINPILYSILNTKLLLSIFNDITYFFTSARIFFQLILALKSIIFGFNADHRLKSKIKHVNRYMTLFPSFIRSFCLAVILLLCFIFNYWTKACFKIILRRTKSLKLQIFLFF